MPCNISFMYDVCMYIFMYVCMYSTYISLSAACPITIRAPLSVQLLHRCAPVLDTRWHGLGTTHAPNSPTRCLKPAACCMRAVPCMPRP